MTTTALKAIWKKPILMTTSLVEANEMPAVCVLVIGMRAERMPAMWMKVIGMNVTWTTGAGTKGIGAVRRPLLETWMMKFGNSVGRGMRCQP